MSDDFAHIKNPLLRQLMLKQAREGKAAKPPGPITIEDVKKTLPPPPKTQLKQHLPSEGKVIEQVTIVKSELTKEQKLSSLPDEDLVRLATKHDAADPDTLEREELINFLLTKPLTL